MGNQGGASTGRQDVTPAVDGRLLPVMTSKNDKNARCAAYRCSGADVRRESGHDSGSSPEFMKVSAF